VQQILKSLDILQQSLYCLVNFSISAISERRRGLAATAQVALFARFFVVVGGTRGSVD
jgi:hypothetical protein